MTAWWAQVLGNTLLYFTKPHFNQGISHLGQKPEGTGTFSLVLIHEWLFN